MKFSRNVMLAGGTVAVFCTALVIFADTAPAEPEAALVRPPASITVDVVTPTLTAFPRTLAATGTVRARDELLIGSDLAGVRLLAVHVEVGSQVRQGQLLAEGDASLLRAQLAQQEALVKQADASLRLARANLERARRLRGSGAISAEELENRETTGVAAVAELELATARRRELAVKVAQTRITAPADGIIASKAATVGAVVQPGTELFRLIRGGELEWLAELPGPSLAKVESGSKARLLLAGGDAVEASVRRVAPTIDPVTRNGVVHVSLGPDAPFAAGDLARGEILIGRQEVITLPEAAILTRDGRPFVYVVGPNEIARLIRIETGDRQRGLVEVAAGLDAHARVVNTGAGFVKDGDLVRIARENDRLFADTGA
jgi:HlyD family secretion protein